MSRPQLSEEELRQLEAELDRLGVDDVIAQTVVTLINLGARKLGLAAPPGAEQSADLPQARKAIDGARALLPLLDGPEAELNGLRGALSQLQMAFVQLSGGAPAGVEPGAPAPAQTAQPDPAKPAEGQPGPAQSSGRLWVPGQ
jgi:hypothetical protein